MDALIYGSETRLQDDRVKKKNIKILNIDSLNHFKTKSDASHDGKLLVFAKKKDCTEISCTVSMVNGIIFSGVFDIPLPSSKF